MSINESRPARILWIVGILHFATHIYTTFLQPLNSELKSFFGLHLDQDVTVFSSIFLAFYAVSNLASGFLVNRVQPRVLMSAGPVFNGLAVMAMGLLTPADYRWMQILLALSAAGGGLYHPVANLLLNRAYPRNMGAALGYTGIGACVAFVAAPWAARSLLNYHVCNWQGVCIAYGAIGVACGLFGWLYIPLLTQEELHGRETKSGRMVTYSGFKMRDVVIFGVYVTLVMGGREMASWSVLAITQQFTNATFVGAPNAGLLAAAVFLPGLLIQPVAGRLSDTLGRERLVCGSLFVIAATLFILPLVTVEWVLPVYLLFGAAISTSVPTFEALLTDRTPKVIRGRMFGAVITAAIVIGATSPLLAGKVADMWHREPVGYRNALWLQGSITFVCFLMAFGLKPLARKLGLEHANRHDASVPATGNTAIISLNAEP